MQVIRFCLVGGGTLIGASDDAIASCECDGIRVAEIKCPFKNKDNTPLEASRIDKAFCLDSNSSLKLNHKHYTQIQIQMFTTASPNADFVVYINKGIAVMKVSRLVKYMLMMWLKNVRHSFSSVYFSNCCHVNLMQTSQSKYICKMLNG